MDEVSVVDRPCSYEPFLQKALGTGGTPQACDSVIPFHKNLDEHTVAGIVYPLNRKPDCQGDYVNDPEELVRAEKSWRNNGWIVGFMHKMDITSKTQVLATDIASHDGDWNGVNVRKGDWVMKIRILDPQLWETIQTWGPKSGFSIGGRADAPSTKSAPVQDRRDRVQRLITDAEARAMCECQKNKTQKSEIEQLAEIAAMTAEIVNIVTTLDEIDAQELKALDLQAEMMATALQENRTALLQQYEANAHQDAIDLGYSMTGTPRSHETLAGHALADRRQDDADQRRIDLARLHARNGD